jgi:agmatinase
VTGEFPGAACAREAASYTVVGAPLDASTTFHPGTRFGPDRMRHAATAFDDYDHHTGTRFTDLGVYDHGDVQPDADVAEYLSFLRALLAEALDAGRTPLVLGGEHTVSLAGVRAVDPDVFVCCDAHLDLRACYRGNPNSHATVTQQALDVADRVVVLGARTGSASEWERARRADVTVVPPREVPAWEPPVAVEAERAYLSVDIDSAAPAVAPGTGTMEPFGLSARDLRDVVRAVAPHAAGFDVVEVNDRDDGQSATLAAKLLRAFVYEHASAH